MIIFDIDGTLSLLEHRLHFLKNKDWDSFYDACGDDTVNEPVAHIARQLMAWNDIVFVTGRRESVREITLNWLQEKIHPDINDADLYMRADGDLRHDTVVKPELIFLFKDQVSLIFEDRNSMVETWRRMGIPTMQVAEGDF